MCREIIALKPDLVITEKGLSGGCGWWVELLAHCVLLLMDSYNIVEVDLCALHGEL